MDFFCLIVYVALWIVTFIKYQRKRKCYDAGSLILTAYLVTSVFSMFLFLDKSGDYVLRGLSLFPFLLLWTLLLLGGLPVLKYDGRGREVTNPNMKIIIGICVIFIIASLLSVGSTIRSFRSGLSLIMTTDEGGADLYSQAIGESENYGRGGLSHLPAVIITALTPICAFFLFYLIRYFKNYKLLTYFLIFSFVLLLMQYISLGSRGSVAEILIIILSSYFIFRPYYSTKTVSALNKLFLILFIMVMFPIVAISISRFASTSGGASSSTFFYLGQSNLYFNKYALDDGGIRYGDRVIPLFKRMAFRPNVPHNFWERRAKYPHLKINDEVFITYAGDFLIDFGPLFGTLILVIISMFFIKITRARGSLIGFHQLIILHLVIVNCTIGAIKLFPFSDVGGNLQLIVYFLAFIVFNPQIKYSSNAR